MPLINISPSEALKRLDGHQQPFRELFVHGTLSVEIYRPVGQDLQTPHRRDELYVVISGTGKFFCDGETAPFGPGDFLFVPAGVDHRFLDFSEDFATWVFFYGPDGGESNTAIE